MTRLRFHPFHFSLALGVLCAALAALTLGAGVTGVASGCGGGGGEEETPTDPFTAGETASLETAVDELVDAGCLTSDAAARLKDAIGSGQSGFSSKVSEETSNLCASGTTLLNAIVGSDATPFFEDGRILFDGGTDGCVESAFDKTDQTITTYDADADGCLDHISEFDLLVDQVEADAAALKTIASNAASLLRQLLDANILIFLTPPAPEEQGDDFDFDTYRANASTGLNTMRESINSFELGGQIDSESSRLFLDFLQNTEPFVEGFTGCSDTELFNDGVVGGALQLQVPEAQKDDSTVTYRFYVWATTGHGWVSLENTAGEKYARGMYKNGYGSKITADPIPKTLLIPRDKNSGFGDGPGYIQKDATYGGCRICWQITKTEWDTIRDKINADIVTPPGYVFTGRNCLGYAGEVAGLIGKTLPAYTNWTVPDPKVLNATIKKHIADGTVPAGAEKVECIDKPEDNP